MSPVLNVGRSCRGLRPGDHCDLSSGDGEGGEKGVRNRTIRKIQRGRVHFFRKEITRSCDGHWRKCTPLAGPFLGRLRVGES